MTGAWSHLQGALSRLTRELRPRVGGAVDRADGKASQTVILELPVPDPKAQEDTVNPFLQGGLQNVGIGKEPQIKISLSFTSTVPLPPPPPTCAHYTIPYKY